MPRGWRNENTTLGTTSSPSNFNNVIDHAIQDHKIFPVIIVCPTYNNTIIQDNSDLPLALWLTKNYHYELVNELIPTIESSFFTYTESTSKEGLMASRDHGLSFFMGLSPHGEHLNMLWIISVISFR